MFQVEATATDRGRIYHSAHHLSFPYHVNCFIVMSSSAGQSDFFFLFNHIIDLPHHGQFVKRYHPWHPAFYTYPAPSAFDIVHDPDYEPDNKS